MRRTLCSPLVLACLAWAGLASPAAAVPETAPVRLVEPVQGKTLQAGSLAEIEWQPLAPLAGVQEWEAFLSLDGGAHYTIRITPHLDQDLRRVQWRVPAVPTSRARLLLRFGDEQRETAVELPHLFVIEGLATPALEPAAVVHTHGEPALPGAPGVVVWAEGSRQGGPTRQVTARLPRIDRGGSTLAEGHGETAVLEAEGQEADPAAPEVAGPAFVLPTLRRLPLLAEREGPPPPIPILLQTSRQNE